MWPLYSESQPWPTGQSIEGSLKTVQAVPVLACFKVKNKTWIQWTTKTDLSCHKYKGTYARRCYKHQMIQTCLIPQSFSPSLLESACSSFLQEMLTTSVLMAAWDIRGVHPVTVSCSWGKTGNWIWAAFPPSSALQLCPLRRTEEVEIEQRSQPPCNRTNTTARQSSLAAGEGPPIKPYMTEGRRKSEADGSHTGITQKNTKPPHKTTDLLWIMPIS